MKKLKRSKNLEGNVEKADKLFTYNRYICDYLGLAKSDGDSPVSWWCDKHRNNVPVMGAARHCMSRKSDEGSCYQQTRRETGIA